MSTDEVIALFAIGMILQILGTASVAYNYYRSAKLAKRLQDKIAASRFIDEIKEHSAPQYLLVRDETIRQLSSRWYLTSGLICYFISAILEFAAGVGALNRR